MIRGIDVNETIKYTLKDDTGANPTVFHVGVLLKRDFFTLLHGVLTDNGTPDIKIIQENAGDIVKKGIKKVQNYAIGKGEPKDYDVVDDALIESLPATALVELAMQVITANFLSGLEQKN